MVQQALAWLPGLAAGFEQVEGALDVGAQERPWPGDGSVHMALGREVNDHLGLVLGKGRAHRLEVDQIGAHEGVVRAAFQAGQAARVRSIGQGVQVDEKMLGVARNQQVQEVRADESGAAGDKYFHVLSGRNHTSIQVANA